MPQFFINQKNISEDIITISDKQDVKHIETVLRLNEGDSITIVDDQEYTYAAKIKQIENKEIICDIASKEKSLKKLNFDLTLAQSILKSTAQDIAVQKATELGVSEIIPLITKYTVVKLKSDKDKQQKVQRWQKIAYEACKQCERANIPVVKMVSSLKDLLSSDQYDIVISCVERDAGMTIKEFLKETKTLLNKNSKVLVIIGPEGGWADEELALFKTIKANKVNCVSLGNLILRAETAVITALSDVIYEYEL